MIDSRQFLKTSSLLGSYYTLLQFSNRMALALDTSMIEGDGPQPLSGKQELAPFEPALRRLLEQAKAQQKQIARELDTRQPLPDYDNETLERIKQCNNRLFDFEKQLTQWVYRYTGEQKSQQTLSMSIHCRGFFARELPVCVAHLSADQPVMYTRFADGFKQRIIGYLPGIAETPADTFCLLYQYACLEPHEMAELGSIEAVFRENGIPPIHFTL